MRGWADKLEELEVHFTLRNDRGTRIYEERDLEVFSVVRDLKEKYGQATQLRDIKNMLIEKHEKGLIKLRTREEAPQPEPRDRYLDLLNQDDIKDLMNNERVKQFMNIVISETYRNLREDLIVEVRESVREEVREEVRRELEENRKVIKLDFEEYNKRAEKELTELQKAIENNIEKNQKIMEDAKKDMQEQLEKESQKGFFAKLFGK
jgi:DNA-binding transcriptional MerR regulator